MSGRDEGVTSARYGPVRSDTVRGAIGAEVEHDVLPKTGDQGREPLERFYADVVWELGIFIRGPRPTAAGAAVVVKRVALAHGVQLADDLPLPRLTRGERERALAEEP